jgi:hypothetical protein
MHFCEKPGRSAGHFESDALVAQGILAIRRRERSAKGEKRGEF